MSTVTPFATIITLHALSLCAGSTFVYSLWRERRGEFITNNDFLVFLLVFSQSLWSFVLIPINVYLVLNGGFVGYIGQVLCQVVGILVCFGIATNSSFHILIALDRWKQVVTASPMSKGLMFGTFLAMFSIVTGIVLLQLSKAPFAVYESQEYCFLSAITTSLDQKLPLLLILIYAIFALGSVLMSYGYIWYLLQTRVSDRSSHTPILLRCVLILVSVIGAWSPSVFALFYRLITDNPISPVLDAICTDILVLDGFLTPIVLLFLNKRYLNAYKSHVLHMSIHDPPNRASAKGTSISQGQTTQMSKFVSKASVAVSRV